MAIVHYWLLNWRGGEKVLEGISTSPSVAAFSVLTRVEKGRAQIRTARPEKNQNLTIGFSAF
jgi:hypothetical protein